MKNEDVCPICGTKGRKRADGSYRCRKGHEWTPKVTVTATKKAPKTIKSSNLNPEVKALNNRLGQKNQELKELRQRKKKGEDVRKEIKNALVYLAENREKKRALVKDQGV